MLPFGSVLSLISGTVLAFIYLLYFGVCALNRNKSEITADALQQKEIFTDNHTNFQDNKFSTAYFYVGEILTEEDLQVRIPEYTISGLKDFPEDIPPVQCPFELTSRPPPFIS